MADGKIAALVSMAVMLSFVAPVRAQTWPAVDAALSPLVEQGELSGVVTIGLKDGRKVHSSAIGNRDLANGAPMEMDTIFRAYSMSKPVTAVAMMVLYDEGRWKPSDPITQFLPELRNLMVFKGTGPDGKPILQAPQSMPTMEQLMTHTAGFGYGTGAGYVEDLYRADSPLRAQSADEFLRKLAALPLLYEPGSEWQYSLSMDVQGAIIERLTGMKLADFMQARIFEPLRMTDTGFYVPDSKRGRFATQYIWQDDKLVVPAGGILSATYADPPGFASGGAGLVTTAGDYARLAQMLLNDGVLDGARVLKAGSAKLIMSDHLPSTLENGNFGIGVQRIRPGYHFGYNGAVVTDPAAAGVDVGKGSYVWDGAAGTWFWADPSNSLVFVGMIQRQMSTGGRGGRAPNFQAISQKAVRETLGY
jgi:CubicO group peptidase (beta-lactamase class C family)